MQTLLSYAWVQGAIMLLIVKCITLILRWKGVSLTEKDLMLQFIVTLSFFGIPFFSQFILGIKNIFWFTFAFAVIGMACEFLFDLIWYRLMGTRLYRYFKGNLLGFTSWYIFPYWAGAGLYFFGSWQLLQYLILNFNLGVIDIPLLIKDLSLIAVTTFMILIFLQGVRDYIKGRLVQTKGFSWDRYALIVISIWVPIIYLVIYLQNIFILIYFLFTSITGVILEGILSRKLRHLYGESFWLYYRYNIFNQGTSLLILPIWGAAALLAFILFQLFML